MYGLIWKFVRNKTFFSFFFFFPQPAIGRISCAVPFFRIFRFKFLVHNTLCDTWTSAVLVLSVFTEQIRHVLFDLAQLCGSKLLQSLGKKLSMKLKKKKKKSYKVTGFLMACLWSERSSIWGKCCLFQERPISLA